MRDLNIHIKIMVAVLKENGIKFYFDQEIAKKGKRLENVVFEKDGKQYKIYEGLFFRDFGQSMYFKKVKGDYALVDFDDKTFYNEQQDRILKYFNKK